MQFIGVDGCEAGWVAAAVDGERGEAAELAVFGSVEELWDRYGNTARLVLIDMPIGLPDETSGARRSDAEAKKLLGARGSTIFPTPSRAAAYAPDFAAANAANRRDTGKGLSKQAYNLVPKIRELDRFLSGCGGAARALFREAHPELSFLGLSGQAPAYKKKDINGLMERLSLLKPWEHVLAQLAASVNREPRPFAGVKPDDALDATVLAIAAMLSAEHGLTVLPAVPQLDKQGLPMEVVFCRIGN